MSNGVVPPTVIRKGMSDGVAAPTGTRTRTTRTHRAVRRTLEQEANEALALFWFERAR